MVKKPKPEFSKKELEQIDAWAQDIIVRTIAFIGVERANHSNYMQYLDKTIAYAYRAAENMMRALKARD